MNNLLNKRKENNSFLNCLYILKNRIFILIQKTATTNSSARILPNNLKLKERGLVKSSKTLIGKRIEN